MLPEPESAAEILSMYYNDREKLAADGKWCYDRVHEKPFTWPYIGKQMKDIVESVLNQKEEKPEFKGFGTPARIA
jgi:hypothetical protein